MEFSRLPTNVKPLHYELSLTPSFEEFTFEGQQSIDIIVSNFLIFHVSHLYYNYFVILKVLKPNDFG